MATKYPKKLIELVEMQDIDGLHKYLKKNDDKSYKLALYASYILKTKDNDFFVKSCLEWKDNTSESKELFLTYMLNNLFKKYDAKKINHFLSTGVNLENHDPFTLLRLYLESELPLNPEMHSIIKSINWKEVIQREGKDYFKSFSTVEEVDFYFDIVGKDAFPSKVLNDYLFYSLCKCDKKVIDKLIKL